MFVPVTSVDSKQKVYINLDKVVMMGKTTAGTTWLAFEGDMPDYYVVEEPTKILATSIPFFAHNPFKPECK